MLKFPRLLPALLLTTLALATTAGTASAQEADGFWLKVTVTAKGYQVNDTTDIADKTTLKTTTYMQLHWNDMDMLYDFDLWTLGANEIWTSTFSGSLGAALGDTPAICSDVAINVPLADGNIIAGQVNMVLTIKLDSDDVTVKSISLKSAGGLALDPSVSDTHPFRGDLKVKGKTIDQEKLPFIPT